MQCYVVASFPRQNRIASRRSREYLLRHRCQLPQGRRVLGAASTTETARTQRVGEGRDVGSADVYARITADIVSDLERRVRLRKGRHS
jgi:hypothetical protein